MAETIIALQHLHARSIAYRDLKPENVLIGGDGHIKIADFGFAKQIKGKSYTLCGSPEYMAPEIIMGNGHNQGVDWWAMGVFLFEMLSGYSPFYDRDTYSIYKRIAIGYYEIPEHIEIGAKHLISKLLE